MKWTEEHGSGPESMQGCKSDGLSRAERSSGKNLGSKNRASKLETHATVRLASRLVIICCAALSACRCQPGWCQDGARLPALPLWGWQASLRAAVARAVVRRPRLTAAPASWAWGWGGTSRHTPPPDLCATPRPRAGSAAGGWCHGRLVSAARNTEAS